MLLFPLPFARNKENGKINLESWYRLCTIHYETGLYSSGCKEKIAVEKAVFWSTVQTELTRIKNFFVENIHS